MTKSKTRCLCGRSCLHVSIPPKNQRTVKVVRTDLNPGEKHLEKDELGQERSPASVRERERESGERLSADLCKKLRAVRNVRRKLFLEKQNIKSALPSL